MCYSHTESWKRPWGMSQNGEQECGLEKHWINSIIVSILDFWEIKQTSFIWVEERKTAECKTGQIFWAGGYIWRLQSMPNTSIKKSWFSPTLIYCYRSRNLKTGNDLPNLLWLVCRRIRVENWARKTQHNHNRAGSPRPGALLGIASWPCQAVLALWLLL